MYIYDRANALAQDIKESEEYKTYRALKDELFADESTKAMLKDYKKMQFQAQATLMAGSQPDAETMEKLQKLGEVLAFNPRVSEYFAAEYKFNTIISDIYKIIGAACDIEADIFQD